MKWSMMMLSLGKRAAAALWTTAGAPVSLRATRKPVTPRMDMERTASQMPLSGAVHPARKHMYVFMLLRSLSLFPSSFSSAVSLAWTADMQCNRSIEVCVCQCNEIWCLDHRLFTFACNGFVCVCVGTDLVEEVYLSEYCVCLFQSLAKAFIYFWTGGTNLWSSFWREGFVGVCLRVCVWGLRYVCEEVLKMEFSQKY